MIWLLLLMPVFAHASSFEGISDVDDHFFLQNPELPWGKDAFRGTPEKGKLITIRPTLQGIAKSGEKSIAVVDGQAVGVGDSVSGRRVVQIGPNFVVLEKRSSLIELRMPASVAAPEKGPNQ